MQETPIKFPGWEDPLEEGMATHSSILAWKIPWMEEPGRLQSMGSLRVRHDWATSLSLFPFMHWRRKWQPTPVFLLGESQGRGSLVGCRLWGRTVGHDWSDLAAAAAAYIYPLFSDAFPKKSLVYWGEFPVLWSRFLLVIYCIYRGVYVSIPVSQFIPPLPFPHHRFVFYNCDSTSAL